MSATTMTSCKTVSKSSYIHRAPRFASRKVTARRPVSANATFPNWNEMWEYLTVEKKVKTVSPQKAQELASTSDWVIVDVRPKEVFDKGAPEGAFNAPLFQAMDFSKATPGSILKAAAYAFNGVKPVELNPLFIDEVKKATAGKKAIVCCEAGGTLRPSANFMNGKTSRSLKAAWMMLNEGLVTEVAHLDGGVYNWWMEELPMTGDYDASEVGRTPNAAKEPVYKGEAASKK